jgi:hypothetical protein
MRPGLIVVLALVAVQSLSACGSIPQPFRPLEASKKHNEFLLAPNSAGVVIKGIKGPVGWVGAALTEAMATALRDQGIVAGSRWSNRLSLQLSGNGYQKLHKDRPSELVMIWSLADQTGRLEKRREILTTPPDEFWERPTAAMFRDVADHNAAIVVSWIDPTRQKRAPVDVEMPGLSIAPIGKVPGDGATSLARAVELALKAERIPVVDDGQGELFVTSRIAVTPAPDNSEDVSITWILSKPDGTEIGRVAQENTIPAGQLNGRWGAIAVAIADGAADGIAGLARAYRDARGLGASAKTQ